MGSKLSVDWFGLATDIVDVSTWTNKKTEKSHQKRSDIIHAIIHNHSQDHLRRVLRSGWDVNETLSIPDYELCGSSRRNKRVRKRYKKRTALQEAGCQGWTQGVKMLLDAGAECRLDDEAKKAFDAGVKCTKIFGVSGFWENPLTIALQNSDCPPDVIQLLLTHGADPNDLYDRLKRNPLLCAIAMHRRSQNVTKIVELLLEHGANPNVAVNMGCFSSVVCPLNAVLCQPDQQMKSFMKTNVPGEGNNEDDPTHSAAKRHEVSAALFNILMQFGANVNYNVDGRLPLLHSTLSQYDSYTGQYKFPQNQLDLIFQHGGNIDMEDSAHRTALEYVVQHCGNSNSIRWLIRHGADTSTMRISLLKGYFQPLHIIHHFPEIPLFLLQADMRISHAAHTQLSNMALVISTRLQDSTDNDGDLGRKVKRMWDQVEKAESKESPRRKHKLRKSTFPEYWGAQAAALREFSDESLYVYHSDNSINQRDDGRQRWQNTLDQIQPVLEFLSQPPSLQWQCRRCVRENLMSFQPSVVKSLPVPARLKRYLMCHEI